MDIYQVKLTDGTVMDFDCKCNAIIFKNQAYVFGNNIGGKITPLAIVPWCNILIILNNAGKDKQI